ncbi:ankyrin repeat-containing domain protein [Lasiosphaeria ovina]|uniref:Ankyrin repeat-containing domain protein n=1 Tax=Lasiosphaeria ovina TaxID=92902 RepID=A0AAE0TYH7_9PEZI|nr:ankyrin repeat-containing domain protein [Lasiosphaeria ovina]
MEVVGAIAGFIAIGQAIAGVHSMVVTLRTLPMARGEVISLINEAIQSFTAQDEKGGDLAAVLASAANSALLRGTEAELKSVLVDLQQLCSSSWLGLDKTNKPKPSRLKWVRNRGKIAQIYERTRTVRLNLQLAMAAVSLRCHQSQTKLLLEIRDISLPSYKSANLGAPTPEFSDEDFVVDSVFESATEYPSTSTEKHPHIMSRTHPKPRHTKQTTETEMFYVETALQGHCARGCRCQCHRTEKSTRTSPWLALFLGSLFVNYNSIPVLRPVACDSGPSGAGCRRQRKGSLALSFRYYFPAWLWPRYVEFHASVRSMTGLGASLHVALPRVLAFTDPVWPLIMTGDVPGFRNVLEAGRVFLPTDHLETGTSLMTQALNARRFEMVRFLTDMWEPLLRQHGAARDSLAGAHECLQETETASTGDLDENAQALVRYIAFDQDPDEYVRTGVHHAVLGDGDVGEAVRADPSAIDSLDQYGVLPLQLAADHGHEEAVRVLIAHGADVDRRNHQGETALHFAARNGHVGCTRLLVDAGSAIDAVDSASFDAVQSAVGTDSPGQADVLRMLLFRKPSRVHYKLVVGKTPLMTLARRQDDMARFAAAFAVLIDAGADLEAQDFGGLTVLLQAAKDRQPEKMRFLMAAGARIDAVSSVYGNVLHIAAAFANVVLLEFLDSMDLSMIDVEHATEKRGTPWDVLRFVMTRSELELEILNRPTKEVARRFAAFFRKVRDQNLQHDLEILAAVLESLRLKEGEMALKDLAPLIQRKESWNRNREAETFRTVRLQIKQAMWEAAVESVEENIEKVTLGR